MNLKEIGLFAVVIGGFLGYKYYQKNMQDSVNVQENVVVEDQNLNQTPQRALRLNEAQEFILQKRNECVGELQKWCQMMAMNEASGEGFLSKGNLLVGAVEIGKEQNLSEAFKAIAPKKQKEILLLKRVLQREFLNNFRRHGVWTSVQVIGFTTNEQQKRKPELLIELKRNFDVTKFSGLLINSVLDETFNYGNVDALSIIEGNYTITHYEDSSYSQNSSDFPAFALSF